MKIFILEDNPERMKFFRWYFSVEKFQIFHADNVFDAEIIYEKEEPFDLLLLDHDLGGEVYVDSNNQNTGYQFAKFLITKDLKNIPLIIHSLNPYGVDNMKSLLPQAHCISFPILAHKLVNKEMVIE